MTSQQDHLSCRTSEIMKQFTGRREKMNILSLMLKLYQSQPLTGFRYLYGRKGDRFAIQVTRKRLLDIYNSKDLMER